MGRYGTLMEHVERQRAEYGLETLRQLRSELENINQFAKYPFDVGGPSWIDREIQREEKLL